MTCSANYAGRGRELDRLALLLCRVARFNPKAGSRRIVMSMCVSSHKHTYSSFVYVPLQSGLRLVRPQGPLKRLGFRSTFEHHTAAVACLIAASFSQRSVLC